jgi:hypothetical protein
MKLSGLVFVAFLLHGVSADSIDSQTIKNNLVGAIKKQQKLTEDVVDGQKVKNVVVEAIQQQQVVSEASVVFPQNLTFPAPKTYAGLGTDLGEPQHLDTAHSNEIYQRIEEAREYVENEILGDEKLKSISHLCKNQHSSCAFWSVSLHGNVSLRSYSALLSFISLMHFLLYFFVIICR